MRIGCAAQSKCGPAGVGKPTMFGGESLREEFVTDGTRERDIERTVVVQVPQFSFPKAKLGASERMPKKRYPRPSLNLAYEMLQISDLPQLFSHF